MTEGIGRAARAAAAQGTEVTGRQPADGAGLDRGSLRRGVAAIGVIDEVREGKSEGFDGYVIASFGDPAPARGP